MMDIEKLENCPSCKKDLGQGEYDGQYCKSCNTGMGFSATQADEVKVIDGLEESIKTIAHFNYNGEGDPDVMSVLEAAREHLKRQKGR